jgi:hypothetical protein
LVRISVRTPAVLIEVLCVFVFHEVLQADAGIVRQLGDDLFLPDPFQFILRPIIRRCDVAVK